MKIFFTSILLSALCCVAQAATYSVDPENCRLGQGGPGVIVTGSGNVAIEDTFYRRIGPGLPAPGGFVEARFDTFRDGKRLERSLLRIRLSDDRVDIVTDDGRRFVADRCK